MSLFQLRTSFEPAGDQPEAIRRLTEGIKNGKRAEVLLGITGSGKTFTMANVICEMNRPCLILAHNKTLAAQLYEEFKAFFPENAVEYFVSYYDYYQPEAYLPRSDTYIEKDMSINDRIDRLRLNATKSLLERRDVIIIASVSCIYGLGVPEYYAQMNLKIEAGQSFSREKFLHSLVEIHYKRNDYDFKRGEFRVRGDIIDIFPAYEEDVAVRLEFYDKEIERISLIDPLTTRLRKTLQQIVLFPASHFVTPAGVRALALSGIRKELEERSAELIRENKISERERLWQRTTYDMELIKEMGFCKGIENYSRHFSHRKKGEPPPTLIDYFPKDYLLFIDESHQTIPQVRAMYHGDRARKESLVDFGFRLPSAYDNRPLNFDEFYQKINQAVYVSATPGEWEIQESGGEVIEQVIRPTGLLDPLIEIRPASTQVDDSLEEIHKEVEKEGRVLVTTLTKKLAEDLTKYLVDLGVKAQYLHSDVDTLERIKLIRELRMKKYDVLVGINLLREGLDIPEVSLVVILDADKEGFLRSTTSLLQTCGRAARNSEGRVILYADKITKSIAATKEITENRRKNQMRHNEAFGIIPQTVKKDFHLYFSEETEEVAETEMSTDHFNLKEVREKIKKLEKEMLQKARSLDFEAAAALRDEMKKYQKIELTLG